MSVSSLITAPQPADVEVLWAHDEPVALRALSVDSQDTLTLSLGRVSPKADISLIGQFLLSDVVYRAIRRNQDVVKVESVALPAGMAEALSDMGFVECNGGLVRFCFTRHLNRREALEAIAKLVPEASASYQALSDHQLMRSCSPMASTIDQKTFLVPIKSAFALNLFDRQQSSYDLFGGEPSILMLWSNTYYRAKTLHKLIQPPGRILWYVSGGTGEIVAVSHLDEVVIDTPKELFRRFKRSGTLQWEDIYDLCKGDISTELMAIAVPLTPFRCSVEFLYPRYGRPLMKMDLAVPCSRQEDCHTRPSENSLNWDIQSKHEHSFKSTTLVTETALFGTDICGLEKSRTQAKKSNGNGRPRRFHIRH